MAKLGRKELLELDRYDKMLSFYRNDPIEACRDLLKRNPIWFQRKQLKELWYKSSVVMRWGRGASKSSLAAMYFILRAMLFPDSKIGIIAPGFRQASFVFDEIDILYNKSPFIRAAAKGPATRSNLAMIIRFKNGSFIEALPIGSDKGNKVRGRRYNYVGLDEFAQIDPDVVNLVIRPMLMVKSRARDNQIVFFSTPFYKNNHFYEQWLSHKKLAAEQPDEYSYSFYNFMDVMLADNSDFEIDVKEVIKAKNDPSNTDVQFLMEYAGIFPDEGEGSFFPPYLIDQCTPRGLKDPIEIEVYGDGGHDYVMGVDPARDPKGDFFALSLVKVFRNSQKELTRVLAHQGLTFQQMRDIIRQQIHVFRFNVKAIYLGYGGGGAAIKDLLREEWDHNGIEYSPIVDVDDPENYSPMEWGRGMRILHMVKETQPLNEMMYSVLKSEMEQQRILFPMPIRKHQSLQIEEVGRNLAALQNEMVETKTQSTHHGTLKFDVPHGMHNDRLVSLIFANYGIYELTNKLRTSIKRAGLPVGSWLRR